jgi:RNA 2',3'-cyclic 3'-phosphodiesterase
VSDAQQSRPAEEREGAARQGPLRARLFFALWPDPAVQAALAELGRKLQDQLGGKSTRQESVHLTLAFLGDVAPKKMDEVLAAAARAAFEPFSFVLDAAGCWNHNAVAWVGPREMPPPLLRLVGSLGRALLDGGFRVDGRPYAAHVTVVRKARCKAIDLTIVPVQWRVTEFVLVRSELNAAGSRYSVIGRWPKAKGD